MTFAALRRLLEAEAILLESVPELPARSAETTRAVRFSWTSTSSGIERSQIPRAPPGPPNGASASPRRQKRLERATSNGTWPERKASLNRVPALANWACPASSRPAFMYVRPRLDLFHQPLRVCRANTASFHRRLEVNHAPGWFVVLSFCSP